MQLLPFDTIRQIHQRAVDLGLHRRREAMLAGLDPAYVGRLEDQKSATEQLLTDLANMNTVRLIRGGVSPLREWLATAAMLLAAQPDQQRFFSDLADSVAKTVAALDTAPKPTPSVAAGMTLPERVLFKTHLLPASFVAGASRTIAAVTRMKLPQIYNGEVQYRASSHQLSESFGTGWLIGKQHIITNFHVVEARDRSFEPPASQADIDAQCAAAKAEFGYDFQDRPPDETIAVARLAHASAALDYAILELKSPVARAPLPLRKASLSINAAEPFPVNIVQHPKAAAKQIAIRNNLVVSQRGNDLAYFTDTADGSSGSPVCDDAWRVVALHKAATQTFGTLQFQGQDTVWVNIGTPIGLIIEDLKGNAPQLWTAIDATLV